MLKIFVFFFAFTVAAVSAQDKKIDRLEVYYDQGHYTKTLRQSKKLLANPEYDYSGLPSFYKSIAQFRLIGDPTYYKRHKKALKTAIDDYHIFLDHQNANHYIKAHYSEIASLKPFLKSVQKYLLKTGHKADAKTLQNFINTDLKNIKGNYVPVLNNPDENPIEPNINSTTSSDIQNDLVKYAKKYIGVEYVWAGSDPSGFDCSGYTSYVLKHFDVNMARTASGQMEGAKKVSISNAQKGDLVFFGHSGKITHVGIIISNKGEALTMIHASSSKGIMITNIETSSYWKPKLKGIGRVL